MFRPMALTVIFALVGSLILSLTLMPVLASGAFRKGLKEKETMLLRWAKRIYRPLLERAVDRPYPVVLAALLVFALSLTLIPWLGAEFVPRLGEGTIAVQAWRLPSVSLSESVKSTTMIEKILLEFPEVESVISRTGQAEIPTDPMGVETSDIYVLLKPWTSGRRRAAKRNWWTTSTRPSPGACRAIFSATRSRSNCACRS